MSKNCPYSEKPCEYRERVKKLEKQVFKLKEQLDEQYRETDRLLDDLRKDEAEPLAGKEDHFVKVWSFRDAPEKYRSLSEHGDDEDWVAFIPESIKDEYFPWMEDGTEFGFKIDEYKVEGGLVRIGLYS